MFVVRNSLLLIALSFFSVSSAKAVPINYGDFAASTVVYHAVTEDSSTGDTLPLYNVPEILAGNTLDFDPMSFVGNSAGGAAADSTNGLLSLFVTANAGYGIKNVSVYTAGDYTLAGNGTALTNVAATIGFILTILEVDGAAVSPVDVAGPINPSPSDGTFSLPGEFGIVQPWSANGVIDLSAVLNGLAIPYSLGVTKFNLKINETLFAASQSTTVAFISNKDFYLQSTTVQALPEPASCALLGLGLAGLAARSRRRKA